MTDPAPLPPLPQPPDLFTRIANLIGAGKDFVTACYPVFREIAITTAAISAAIAAINSWRHTHSLDDLQKVATNTQQVVSDAKDTITDVKAVQKSTELATFKLAVNQIGDKQDVAKLNQLQAATQPATLPAK
jgi:hypothetical protein